MKTSDGLQQSAIRRCPGFLASTILVATLAAGCKSPEQRVQTDVLDRQREGLSEPNRVVLGRSVKGRPIECLVYGDGGAAVLIMATIHGSEAAGTPLVRRLAEHLGKNPDLLHNRKVVLIAVANPDGLARGVRHNASGVDLNRNFPASNWRTAEAHGSTALSEPESAAILQAVRRYQPDRVVSIHQPLACIDYDGPAEGLARAMAIHADLPVKKLGGRPGSLGSYVGITMGIPIITLELPASASLMSPAALWDRYGRLLVAAICFPEPVMGDGMQEGR